MNILADFHHSDLFWSLQLLADRLGAKLYRPYGMEWYDQGYYKLYGNLNAKDPDRWIAKQYLIDTLFGYAGYFKIGRETYNGCPDYPIFNTLAFEDISKMQIDVIICSVHENEPYFSKLKEFWPNAKFIRHCGNDLDTNVDESLYPNLMSAAIQPFEAFKGPNKVLCKEEWDMNLSKYEPPTNFKNIYSFQGDLERFEDTWSVWTDLKHKLRDYTFKAYGVGNEDGKIYPKRKYYAKMLESTFGFQSKGPWEGYGFTIHNSIYLGRPVIIRYNEYADKIAAPLLKEGVSYLEMDDPELPDKIRFYSEPERFKRMSQECHDMWNQIPSFDEEFIQIKEFFEELV